MNEVAYQKSFELFLRKTDEKVVIEDFVRDAVFLHRDMSFLDIGGGDGSLTLNIARKVGRTTVVEPNRGLCKGLTRHQKIRVINKKWEDIHLAEKFDFILAAYVVTYFPRSRRKQLIRKMYHLLNPGGKLLILSVDAKKGSWRKVHSRFYELMGHFHHSSDDALKRIVAEYDTISKSFKTSVIARNTGEMMEILHFDFHNYPDALLKFSEALERFLRKYKKPDGKIVLEMTHNAYLITKQ